MKRETVAVHGGEKENSFGGAINTPIFQSSTYILNKGADYHDVKYMRLSNSPNHLQVHQKLAHLESAEQAVVTASGMAAIATVLLTHLEAGDHMLAQSVLYGGTNDLLREDLPKYGINSSHVDLENPESWTSALTPNTRLFYVESLTNPLLQVGDLQAVIRFCKKHNLTSVIDNTFLTPMNFRPIEMGFDFVVHSATKALNGHSDVIAGAIMGSKVLMKPVLKKLNHLGGFMDVNTIFLLNRGLKTLALRVEKQNSNALRLAEFLESHPQVKKVIYPGLSHHPHHKRAKEWFSGFGSMVAMELKGSVEDADRFLSRLKIFIEAPSLGGVESLVTRPVTSSHSGLTIEDRKRAGISDTLIRISVGIENIDDLIEDIKTALH